MLIWPNGTKKKQMKILKKLYFFNKHARLNDNAKQRVAVKNPDFINNLDGSFGFF